MGYNPNKLMVVKCKGCGKLYTPPAYICSQCGLDEFEEVELTKKGTVRTYTTIRVPPLGFEDQSPYDIAIIEVPEGINILARLVTYPGKEPKVGDEATFIKREAGAYWFKVAS